MPPVTSFEPFIMDSPPSGVIVRPRRELARRDACDRPICPIHRPNPDVLSTYRATARLRLLAAPFIGLSRDRPRRFIDATLSGAVMHVATHAGQHRPPSQRQARGGCRRTAAVDSPCRRRPKLPVKCRKTCRCFDAETYSPQTAVRRRVIGPAVRRIGVSSPWHKSCSLQGPSLTPFPSVRRPNP